MGKRGKVGMRRYVDRLTTDLQAGIDRRVHGLQAEIDGRERLIQAEIDRRLTSVHQRFADLMRLTDKAEQAMSARLEGMNEFRAAISDQAAGMVPRLAFEAAMTSERDRSDAVHGALAARLKQVEGVLDRQRGRQAAYAAVAAAVGALIPVLVIILTHAP